MIDTDLYKGILALVTGCLTGSFLNVVIYRMPREKSLVLPGSKCPGCDNPIAFYDNIPVKDSTYYKKPFFGDRLEQFFSPIIEDKIMSEEEKYINIKKRVLLTIKRLENNPQRNKFYNIMVRYFVNVQYPQIIPTIDTFLDINYLLTPEDRKAYLYRMTQKELIHSKSPPILSESNQIIDFVNQEKNYLVFVGNNTPFSTAVLQQLNMATQNKNNEQVTAILFTDNAESIQNL